MPRRTAIYAHFDADGEVKRYVEHHLRALREVCDRVLFVSTASLPDEELARAREVADVVMQRRNEGLDFGSWQAGLAELELGECDELLLTNSSVIGPVHRLEETLRRMAPIACDFWSLTEGMAPTRHLQSYFLVFRRAALRSPAFAAFWASVLPYRDKAQVVLSYELGLTRFFVEQGLRPAAAFPYDEVMSAFYGRWPRLRGRPNQTYAFAAFLIEQGFPYVKVEALRGVLWHERPLAIHRLAERLRTTHLLRTLERTGFDTSLIEVDRRALPPTLR